MPLSDTKRQLLAQRLAGRKPPAALPPVIPRRPPGADGVLSPAQARIWYLHQLDPDSPEHTLVNAYWCRGLLDAGRANAALNAVVSRHEVLHTVYPNTDGVPHAKVLERVSLEIDTITVSGGRPAIMERARKEARRPFHLEQDLPIRLLQVNEAGAGESLVMLVCHHIAIDLWSLGIFWKEWTHCYSKHGIALPELVRQYGDFAAYQVRKGAALQDQLTYWKAQLADLPELRPLRLGTPHQHATGALAVRVLPGALAEGVNLLARKTGGSCFHVTLAAFQLLIGRYTRTDDVIVGTPVANRQLPETADLIGFFLSTVALRSRLDPAQSVSGLLQSVQGTVAEALRHQDVPFDQVVESINPPRVPDQHPVFQTMLVYQREAEAAPLTEAGDVRFELTYVDIGTSKFDLTLFVAERGGGLEVVAEYRADRLEGAAVERLLGHYGEILRGMVADPEARLEEIDWLPAAERRQLLVDWQGAPLPVLPDSVLEPIWNRARQHETAVSCDGQALTYSRLTAQADGLAGRLIAAGVRPGDRVGLFVQRGTEAVAGLLGILRAGAAYVPVDPDYPSDRRDWMLRDSGVEMVVADRASAETSAGRAWRVLTIEPEAAAPEVRLPSLDPESPAYVIYTSGSSGTPKGVVVSHRNLAASTCARFACYGADTPGRFLLLSGFSFDSSVAGIFWTLAGGGELLLPTSDQARDVSALCRLAATVDALLCVPSLYREMLACDGGALASLQRVIVAGEACSAQLVQRHHAILPQVPLFNEYGPTETTVWATAGRCVPAEDPPTIGRPIPGAKVLVLDERKALVPPGIEGEITIGGAGVATGYWNNAALTEERFIDSPFPEVPGRLYCTGDLAKWTARGELEFLGRRDRQVKVRGHRIELGEVENAIRAIPGVTEAAVIAQPGVDLEMLTEHLLEMSEAEREAMLAEVERQGAASPASPTPQRVVERDKFRLVLEETGADFIRPPLESQRHWLLSQAMAEFADDLEHLDRISPAFVAGDRAYEGGMQDIEQADLKPSEIMEDWQTPLMRAMAEHVTAARGDVLEIGFGRGVAAEFVQQQGVRSHTIVEVNDHSVRNWFEPWRTRHAGQDIRLLHSRWEDVEGRLGMFDGILFHAFPLNEEEYMRTILRSVTFAEHAFEPMARHLRPGGVFTYLSTEIDSFSRRHQRALFRHFRTVELRVERVELPADTRDAWWANSMVVVKAVK